jgi:hypothetical protein
MTAAEIVAIRHLPKRFIRDGTQVATCPPSGAVFAINPEFLPIIYSPTTKTWTRIKWA